MISLFLNQYVKVSGSKLDIMLDRAVLVIGDVKSWHVSIAIGDDDQNLGIQSTITSDESRVSEEERIRLYHGENHHVRSYPYTFNGLFNAFNRLKLMQTVDQREVQNQS